MTQIFFKSMPYRDSSTVWFETMAGLQHRVWLDSSNSQRGRFDVLTAAPEEWHTFAPHSDNTADEHKRQALEFLDLLRQVHKSIAIETEHDNIPFLGGVIGQLTYDFGRCLMNVASNKSPLSTPLAEAGVYHWAIVQDHKLKRCTFTSIEPITQATERCAVLLKAFERGANDQAVSLTSAVQPNLNKQEYRAAFARIREYTLDGDCYQINYSKHYSAQYSGDPARLYLKLRTATSGPFSAFFQGSKSTTLSLSPERLVSIQRDQLLTQPIKGTAPRSKHLEQDRKRAANLECSEKNRAENVMIVDLLRNDFGKVCVPGTINVPQLFELQSFSAVHHLVSSIRGQLAENMDAFDVLYALFPGGSITGAPKRRAMEIIEELEPHQRSTYCGSLFYLSSCGKFDSNILIRTLLCDKDTINCWGGGGIVLDSTADEEWDEIQDKIGILLGVLDTIREESSQINSD